MGYLTSETTPLYVNVCTLTLSGETKKMKDMYIVHGMWKRTQANHLLSLCPCSASRPRTTLPRWNLHSIFFLYAGFHPKVVLGRRLGWVWGPHGKPRGAFFTSRSTTIVGYKKLWSRVQSRVEVSFPTNPSLKCILPLKSSPRKYNSCSRAFGRETHF